MPQKTIRQALNEALAQEMRRDPTIIVIGEDVSGGAGTDGQRDAYGGVPGVTKGLIGEFGEARVIDTPITESAIMGAAAGAAVTGLRPVAELMFSDFFGVCFDQIFNQAAKFRYMFGGKAKTPLVIRTMIGAGRSAAAQHSQSPYHIFTSVPGLKCVVPSNAYDAKGLLIQAIRDDDPVIFCEHKLMYDLRAEVPDEPYTIPFGEANIVRDGDDVTVVALARMVHYAMTAAEELEKDGIEPGSAAYEKHGICAAVTWPRVETVLTGRRRDKSKLPGKYLDGRAMSEGGVGDTVTIQNPASYRMISGVVTAPGVVRATGIIAGLSNTLARR